MQVNGQHYRTIWMEGSTVRMINQPLIPHRFEILSLEDYHQTACAIRDMIIRGAGAIGASGGYGMAQAILCSDKNNWKQAAQEAAKELGATRPTAQNLFYAINRVLVAVEGIDDFQTACGIAAETAQAIADDDAESCQQIGQYGAELIKDGARVLTHCNAGWLAFVDWGSALAPVFQAHRAGKQVFVFADETRPRCQGARLTAWELCEEGIEHAVIADNAAGHLMATGQIDMVIVGSDRIARNGDVANKIGTYTKAVLAQRHNIPFYVAAPTTTIDFECPDGASIPIEERDEQEVLCMFGRDTDGEMRQIRIAPEASHARNPAFDVTPAELVKAVITQKGIIEPQDISSGEQELRAP